VTDSHVDVAALRAAAKALVADGGPITFLQNAQAQLQSAYLGSWGLTVLGMPAAGAHDDALRVHQENLKGGIAHLRDAADKLNTAASNWERSDQPWVVKDGS
jgi:hypothetical protein